MMCFDPKVSRTSLCSRSGVNIAPRTAGGVFWYPRDCHSRRPARVPPGSDAFTRGPAFQSHSDTVCPSSPHTVTSLVQSALKPTQITARIPFPCLNIASGASATSASTRQTIALGSAPISPLAHRLLPSCIVKHRTSST